MHITLCSLNRYMYYVDICPLSSYYVDIYVHTVATVQTDFAGF